jgi:hypothetical protein
MPVETELDMTNCPGGGWWHGLCQKPAGHEGDCGEASPLHEVVEFDGTTESMQRLVEAGARMQRKMYDSGYRPDQAPLVSDCSDDGFWGVIVHAELMSLRDMADCVVNYLEQKEN